MNLALLADKYENKEFLVGDPSQFMHMVKGDSNKELLAFIASCFSYGSRKQFIPKIRKILDWCDGEITEWIVNGDYIKVIPYDNSCYYRLYTNSMVCDMLGALRQMLQQYGSMRMFIKAKVREREALSAIAAICKWFAEHNSHGIIPKDTKSSCKRICMFLRWMVRDNSPVDIGLWSDIIDKRTLIIPMDTHVVQESLRLGLTQSRSTSMSAAIKLTQRLAEIFPGDPTKGDYALFGIGVEPSHLSFQSS